MNLVRAGEAMFFRRMKSYSDCFDLEIDLFSSKERTDMDIPILAENAVEPVIAVAVNEAGDFTNRRSSSVASVLLYPILKLLALVYLLFQRLGGLLSARHARPELEDQQHRPGDGGSSNASPLQSADHHQVVEQNSVRERLQHLESLVDDLYNMQTDIPKEKEDMLQESLSRIRSIEYDLQKTKKVLIATASKQFELAQSFENLKDNSKAGASGCWPRSCRSISSESFRLE